MALSLEDIKKISQLAKININPEQEEIVLKKLKNILNLVEKMQSIDTEENRKSMISFMAYVFLFLCRVCLTPSF